MRAKCHECGSSFSPDIFNENKPVYQRNSSCHLSKWLNSNSVETEFTYSHKNINLINYYYDYFFFFALQKIIDTNSRPFQIQSISWNRTSTIHTFLIASTTGQYLHTTKIFLWLPSLCCPVPVALSFWPVDVSKHVFKWLAEIRP